MARDGCVVIHLIVPSRGRPERAYKMALSAKATSEVPVAVTIVADHDDPALPEYQRQRPSGVSLEVMGERIGYARSLNVMAARLWDDYAILGAFGDDVLFRTPGWDRLVEDALQTPGIAYGNDLVHAKGHPTAIWMSSVIAKALGYLAIPQSRHLWVDDAWKQLGQDTGTLRYLPDVICEHMHPVVGKAEEDQTYREVYDGELGHKDHLGFLDWQANHAAADADRVRAVLHA